MARRKALLGALQERQDLPAANTNNLRGYIARQSNYGGVPEWFARSSRPDSSAWSSRTTRVRWGTYPTMAQPSVPCLSMRCKSPHWHSISGLPLRDRGIAADLSVDLDWLCHVAACSFDHRPGWPRRFATTTSARSEFEKFCPESFRRLPPSPRSLRWSMPSTSSLTAWKRSSCANATSPVNASQ